MEARGKEGDLGGKALITGPHDANIVLSVSGCGAACCGAYLPARCLLMEGRRRKSPARSARTSFTLSRS